MNHASRGAATAPRFLRATTYIAHRTRQALYLLDASIGRPRRRASRAIDGRPRDPDALWHCANLRLAPDAWVPPIPSVAATDLPFRGSGGQRFHPSPLCARKVLRQIPAAYEAADPFETGGQNQTPRRWRPLARRARITARPPRVRMRTRNPWVRLRRTTEG